MNRCVCGRETGTAIEVGVCPDCPSIPSETNLPFQQIGNFGWVCPRCSSIYGPQVQSCWKCNQEHVIIGGL